MMLTLGRSLSGAPAVRRSIVSLKDVVSSAVFDVDATQALSYGGSGQTWSNLVPAPADGASKTDYDFYLGATSSATTDDPAFTGSAGATSAYFALDGGDYFALKSGANTAFLNALHKTTGGSDFWIAFAGRAADSAGQVALSTNTSSTTRGITVNMNSVERVQLVQRGDSASASSTSTTWAAVTPGSDYLLVYSYSHSTSTLRSWLNNLAKASETLNFDTTTTNAAAPLALASRSGGASKLASGTRIYAAAMGNAFIDNAQAAQIFAVYAARHGRSYL